VTVLKFFHLVLKVCWTSMENVFSKAWEPWLDASLTPGYRSSLFAPVVSSSWWTNRACLALTINQRNRCSRREAVFVSYCSVCLQKIQLFAVWRTVEATLWSYAKFHSFIFIPAFPIQRIAWAAAPGALEIPHGFQQPLIVLLALHPLETQPGLRCNHGTWYLVYLVAAFPWV